MSLLSLIDKAAEIENGITMILEEKGVIKPPSAYLEIPDEFRSTRGAVASVLVPENWRDYISHTEGMPLAMGINAGNNVLEFLGGGLSTVEERQIIDQFAADPDSVDERLVVNGKIPGHLYFLLQGVHLLDHGKLFKPLFKLREGMKALLGKELHREISEEAGDDANRLVALGDVLPLKPKVTQLTTAGFGGMNAEIAEKFSGQGIRLTPDGKKLLGFLLEIEELGMLGVADVEKLIDYAQETEEVRGMELVTVGDLIMRGEMATAYGLDGWIDWDKASPTRKPRNASVFYLLRGLLTYMQQQAA
jgi:hypothetical protein